MDVSARRLVLWLKVEVGLRWKRLVNKGKKVSREEYQAIVAEKMEEMGAEGDGPATGSGHAVVIRIQQ